MIGRNWKKAVAILIAVTAFAALNGSSAAADEILVVVVQAKASKPYEDVLYGFRSSLQKHHIRATFEVHTIGQDVEQIATVLESAKTNSADLIFTIGTSVTEYVIRKGPPIPIVYSLVLDEIGGASSNVTGVTLEFSFASHFEWMREFLPKARRIGVLYNPKNNGDRIDEARREAARLGLTLTVEAVDKPQDIPAALERIANEADVLWGMPDDIVLNPQTAKHLLLFCYRNRIPFIGPSKAWVKAGALYALDRDYNDIGTQCGEIASSLLQGRESGGIAPQPPKQIALYVNLTTAKHLKLDINKRLLAKADGVF